MTQFDLTGVQMTEEISKFMKSLNSDPLVALIVICHGDGNGNISGVDNQSVPVQVLINSMHTGEEVGQKIKVGLSALKTVTKTQLSYLKCTIKTYCATGLFCKEAVMRVSIPMVISHQIPLYAW